MLNGRCLTCFTFLLSCQNFNSMRLIPLQMIDDGAQFKMPGKHTVFTKINNLAIIQLERLTEEGICYLENRLACKCKTAKGKIFTEDGFFVVEQL